MGAGCGIREGVCEEEEERGQMNWLLAVNNDLSLTPMLRGVCSHDSGSETHDFFFILLTLK